MLSVERLGKTFAGADIRAPALDNVSLSIERGQFYTLLGPSGCGKTTMLRSIAGLERPSSGRIVINGKEIFDASRGIFIPPNKRKIGMVFQSYAIWPHMDVFENVAFPLRVGAAKHSESHIAQQVRQTLELVELAAFERRPASRLSGGQQQRLAIARALVFKPDILLLDEPLSNLDALLRETMRRELRRMQQSLGITTIYVTHDQTEALALSDVIAVMRGGRVVQHGDPKSIYGRPANRFVAEFIGSTNLISGECREPDGDGRFQFAAADLRLLCQSPDCPQDGARILISVRPEHIALKPVLRGGRPDPALTGRIVDQQFLGSVADSIVQVGGQRLRVWSTPQDLLGVGAEVELHMDPKNCVLVPDDGPPPHAEGPGFGAIAANP